MQPRLANAVSKLLRRTSRQLDSHHFSVPIWAMRVDCS